MTAASPDDTQRIQLRSDAPAAREGDEHVLLGQLMAGLARLERREQNTANEVSTLTREVAALRRDLELDREALVRGASSHAAAKSSNRMAALLGTLFVLYEQAAPILGEMWRHR